MKKLLKTILCIFISLIILLVIAVSVFSVTNPDLAKGAFELLISAPGNNIKAAWIFLTSDSSSIGEQIDSNTEKYESAVSNIMQGVTNNETEISKEVLDALNSGKYTEEEMTRIIASGKSELEKINKEKEQALQNDSSVSESTENKDEQVTEQISPPQSEITQDKTDTETSQPITESESSEGTAVPENKKDPVISEDVQTPTPSIPSTDTAPETTQPDTETVQPIETQPQVPSTNISNVDTASYIAKMYVVKSRFINELTSIEKDIRSEYIVIPKDQRTPADRQRIAGQYIKKVATLEVECDKEVDAILDELREKLVQNNMDTTVVDTLLQAYKEEKSLKKAYYLDVYMNGLPDSERAD